MIENRNGLVVDTELLQANGTAERDAALLMMERILWREPGDSRRGTRDTTPRTSLPSCARMNVTPHVAQNAYANRRSAIDERTTRHIGY